MSIPLLVAIMLAVVPLSASANSVDCSVCHGSQANAAPPVDVSGNSATTETGVGAHQSHLGPSSWRAEISCSECHVVPADVGDPGHADTALPAELTWRAGNQRGGHPELERDDMLGRLLSWRDASRRRSHTAVDRRWRGRGGL